MIEIVPLALPDAAGAKLTLTVQELPGPTVEQLLVCEKPALATIPEILRGAVPLLVTVTG